MNYNILVCLISNLFFYSQLIPIQMSYGAHSMYENRTHIEPYYMKGDVFQRDQRYYDQLLERRERRRSPIHSGGRDYSPNHPPRNQIVDTDQIRRLRQQNQSLLNEMQKLNYGGEFGTGDEVVKKHYYNASSSENMRIREQEREILNLQQTIRLNNEKLVKYQQASHELEVRVGNIQAIDKQIYRQLKGASMRDKQLLEKASSALVRGEPKQNVIRILEQVVNS